MSFSEQLEQIIEALLFAADEPLSTKQIKKIVDDISTEKITEIIQQLNEKYEYHAFSIQEVGEGYRLLTKAEFAPWIEKMYGKTRKIKLSPAALETLAIIAYKQPATRAQIAAIRGVDSSGIIRNLLELNLIEIQGRAEEPGRPMIYGTSQKFLEYFGLKNISDLPRIDELDDLLQKEDISTSLGEVFVKHEK